MSQEVQRPVHEGCFDRGKPTTSSGRCRTLVAILSQLGVDRSRFDIVNLECFRSELGHFCHFRQYHRRPPGRRGQEEGLAQRVEWFQDRGAFTLIDQLYQRLVVDIFHLQQRGQFPELVPTSIGTEYAGIAGGRVLNAKHQTSRSSRSRRQVLDRVAAAASSSSRPQPPAGDFPTLTSTSQLPPKPTSAPSRSERKTGMPWTSNGQDSNSGFRPQVQQPSSTIRPQPRTKKTPPPPSLSKSAFPELPAAASNRPPKEFISGNKSLRNILGDTLPVQPAWGQGPSVQPPSPPGPESEPSTPKGRKGKGKQKQTLFTLGSFPT